VDGYLALLYVLEASDFHFENLIASGEHPVPVDLESLFQHRLSDPKGNLVQTAIRHAADELVLRVGILLSPVWINKESEAIDISGLGGQRDQMYPDRVPTWEDMRDYLLRRRADCNLAGLTHRADN
jgi:lantibiotic modifying enzyme